MIRLYCPFLPALMFLSAPASAPSLASGLRRKQLCPKKASEQAYLELYRLGPDHLEPGAPGPGGLEPGGLEPNGLEPNGRPYCHKPGWQDYRYPRGDPPPDMDYGSRTPSHAPDVSH